MGHVRRVANLTLAIGVAATGALFGVGAGTSAASPQDSSDGTHVPLNRIYRHCDFTARGGDAERAEGTAFSLMRSTGESIVADVTLAAAQPNTVYDVRLIQAPRPSSETCAAGDPGVQTAVMTTDNAGAASLTIVDDIDDGSTGSWVYISRPSPFAQTPVEYYTSNVVAPHGG